MIAIINGVFYYVGMFVVLVTFLLSLVVLFLEPIFFRKEHKVRKALYVSALNDRLSLFEEDAISHRFIMTDNLSLKIVLNKKDEQLLIYDRYENCLLSEYPVKKNPGSVISILDRKYSRGIRMMMKDLVADKK